VAASKAHHCANTNLGAHIVNDMRVQLTILTILLFSFSSTGQTVRERPLKKIYKLNFTVDRNPNIRFENSDTTDNVFLRQLRVENNLIDLIKDCKTDLEKLITSTLSDTRK
jgi:transcription termination factor NusB